MKRILRILAAAISVATMMFTTSCKKPEGELSLSELYLFIYLFFRALFNVGEKKISYFSPF